MSLITMHPGNEPATPDTGEIIVFLDEADGKLKYKKDDASVHEFVGQKDAEVKTITVENPENDEDISVMFTDVAITISKIRPILNGTTPSVTWTLRHSTDRSATGNEVITGGTTTTDTTTGSDITSFDDATIPANSHIWLETTAKSGIVTALSVTFFYDED